MRGFDEKRVEGKIKIRGRRASLASPVRARVCVCACVRPNANTWVLTRFSIFSWQLNYARYYIPDIFPEIKDVFVFLDDDVVVTGE